MYVYKYKCTYKKNTENNIYALIKKKCKCLSGDYGLYHTIRP